MKNFYKNNKSILFIVAIVFVFASSVKAATIIGTNITTQGKIGIGIDVPTNDLHVYSTSTQATILIDGLSPMYRWSNQLADPENKNWSLYANENSFKGGAVHDSWSGGDDLWLQVDRNGYDVSSVSFPNGNVGIGTTTPTRKLHIYNDADGTTMFNLVDEGHHPGLALKNMDGMGNWGFYNSFGDLMIGKVADGLDSMSTKLYIDGNTNYVGIGTTLPESNLHIYSSVVDSGALLEGNSPSIKFSDISSPINEKNWKVSAGSSELSISAVGDDWTGGSTWFSALRSGASVNYLNLSNVKLSIGNTLGEPQSKLEVVGNGTENLLNINNQSEEKSFVVNGNGHVGIGTTSPESNLHIYGGDTATSTVQIGGEGSNKGSCLKLRDSDGLGWTYCTTLDGSLNCSITPCN